MKWEKIKGMQTEKNRQWIISSYQLSLIIIRDFPFFYNIKKYWLPEPFNSSSQRLYYLPFGKVMK